MKPDGTRSGLPRFWLFTAVILCAFAPPALSNQPIPVQTRAEDLFVATKWQTREGLPQNSVLSIVQTRDGYLWLGTFNGLVRFDGVNFTAFTVSNTPELLSDSINVLKVASDGTLWIGTGGGGLVSYDGRKFRRVPPEEGFSETEVLYLLNGPDDALFVGTATSLYRYDGRRFSVTAQLPGDMRPLNRVGFDAAGQFWLSTASGFQPLNTASGNLGPEVPQAAPNLQDGYYDLDTGHWRTLDGLAALGRELKGSPTRFILIRGDDIWTSDWSRKDTVLILHRRDQTWDFRGHPALARHDIVALFCDSRGNLWVGLDGGGLVRLQPKTITTYSMAQGLPSENIVSLTEAPDGQLFLGRLGGNRGLTSLNPDQNLLVPDLDPFKGRFVSSCLQSRTGPLWIGTVGQGIFSVENGNALAWRQGPGELLAGADTMITVLFEDRQGAFWIGTESLGAFRYDGTNTLQHTTSTGLPHNKVSAIVQDLEGHFWIGTVNGLAQVSPDGKLTPFRTKDGLGANGIHCALVDHFGVVWIGTAGGGLSRYLGPGNTPPFRTLSTLHGLQNDVIAQLVEDEAGHLWVSSNRGISRLERAEIDSYFSGTNRFVHPISYGTSEGMISEECSGGFQPASLKDRSGRLWFSTVGGLVMIDPSTASELVDPPIVHIESAFGDGVPLKIDGGPGSRRLLVPAGVQTLEIRFTGIEFSAPEKVAFRYQLAGFDPNWVDAGTRRSAFYTGLQPGERSFQVIARNNAGFWNQTGARLLISAQPAWWQTTAFRAALAFLILGTLAAAYALQISRLHRQRRRKAEFARQLIDSQEQERTRIARELHDSLGQNISMIKNSLFRAVRAFEKGAPAIEPVQESLEIASETVEEIRRIAQALRPYQIDRLGLVTAIQFLAEQTSRATGIAVEVTSDNLAGTLGSEAEINLFRIVQEALTNVARHSKATRVLITLKQFDREIVLEISDNGSGLATSPARATGQLRGSGLPGMAERAQIMSARFEIESAPGQGTKIRVRLPALNPAN